MNDNEAPDTAAQEQKEHVEDEEAKERRIAERAKRQKQREDMGVTMAELFGPILPEMCRMFGPDLVINGLLDLACGLTATSFPEEKLTAIFLGMGVRVKDTDFQRHIARHNAVKARIVQPVKAPGIILAK